MPSEVRIGRADIVEMEKLLDVFDHITFNHEHEMVAISTWTVPMLGKLTVSYYVRGNHIALWRFGGSNHNEEDRVWSGELDIPMPGTCAELRDWLKVKLRDKMASLLDA